MSDLFATILRVLLRGFHSRQQLLLENLAVRYQLTVLQRSVLYGVEIHPMQGRGNDGWKA
jgi:hypothetical protein